MPKFQKASIHYSNIASHIDEMIENGQLSIFDRIQSCRSVRCAGLNKPDGKIVRDFQTYLSGIENRNIVPNWATSRARSKSRSTKTGSKRNASSSSSTRLSFSQGISDFSDRKAKKLNSLKASISVQNKQKSFSLTGDSTATKVDDKAGDNAKVKSAIECIKSGRHFQTEACKQAMSKQLQKVAAIAALKKHNVLIVRKREINMFLKKVNLVADDYNQGVSFAGSPLSEIVSHTPISGFNISIDYQCDLIDGTVYPQDWQTAATEVRMESTAEKLQFEKIAQNRQRGIKRSRTMKLRKRQSVGCMLDNDVKDIVKCKQGDQEHQSMLNKFEYVYIRLKTKLSKQNNKSMLYVSVLCLCHL